MSNTGMPRSPLPPEVLRMINPAYCAGLIARAAVRYETEQREAGTVEPLGLPYLLAFLVLPLALHGITRDEILRHNSSYSLHRLVRGSPDVLPGIDRRVESFKPHTRAAIVFGATYGCLVLEPQTLRIQGDKAFSVRLTGSTGLLPAAARAVQAADRLGAWFAKTEPTQVYLTLQLIPSAPER